MLKDIKGPVALTIAGSDSGGSAGVQADLKTFAAFGVHGCTAITCITAQNPHKVLGIEPCSPRILVLQLRAVFDALKPAAVKTGMLYNRELIVAASRFFRHLPGPRRPPVVVDPVMIASSGKRLLQGSAMQALRENILPLATLITPNLFEAAALWGRQICSEEEAQAAALALSGEFGCGVLVKGGHLRPNRPATDFLAWRGRLQSFTSARIAGVKTHGTGCTYSAGIAAGLARGLTLPAAVRNAKAHVRRGLAAGSGHSR